MKWLILIIAIIGFWFFLNNYSNKESYMPIVDTTSVSPTLSENLFSDSSTEFINDLLSALDNYYHASLEIDTDPNSTDLILDLMIGIKDRNSKLLAGDRYLNKYLNSNDEIISLVAKGVLEGSKQLRGSNNKLYELLKFQNINDPDTISIRDATANYLAEQKEGYSLIAMFAPQVGYLIFSPAKTENPSGEIPYLITVDERKMLTDQIDRMFGESLYKKEPNGNKNSVILAVEGIREYLIHETYEELTKP